MNDITSPLRLAVGSHQAGSGRGCAMNVISWESGDATITDLPECADPMLAKIVQEVNDAHCAHRDGDLLCAPCSVEVLALAHRTSGTALTGWSAQARADLYATIAREQADSVAHLRKYAADRAADYAAHATTAAAIAAANAADYAAANAANAAAANAAVYAARAADCAAHAAARAAYATDGARLTRAHAVIDRFIELTGITTAPVAPEVTEAAVYAMVQVQS